MPPYTKELIKIAQALLILAGCDRDGKLNDTEVNQE